MKLLRRLVALAGIACLVATVLFLPRRVPLVNEIVHPYLFGGAATLKLPIVWALAGVYAGAVIVVTALLTFLLRGRG
jgi:hypothetical protein